MSYQYRILKDYPIQAYPLNAAETVPTDVSGNATPASLTTTPVVGTPLVKGGGNSILVSSANKLQFASSAFNGDVRVGFTLEAWFKPLATGRILILGHSGGRDGLQYDGEVITFGTSHGAAGTSVATYYVPEVAGAFHAVGVHSPNKNQLFVNNVLVAEADVTEAQVLAGYDNTDNILYSGTSYTGTPSVLLDFVSVYRQTLTANQISNHFIAGRETTDYRDVVAARGGSTWDFTDLSTLIGFQKVFDTDASWRDGQLGGVTVQGGILSPSFDPNGLSNNGYWTYSNLLSASNPLGGSKIEWDGDGTFVVQSSVDDGVTWTPCVNGREIPSLTEGFDTTNKDFMVRIIFNSGEPLDTITKVRWLSIKLYNDRNLSQSVAGRTIDLTGNVALASDIHQPIELHDDMGLDLYNGTAVISADTSDVPVPVRVVDMWVRPYADTTVAALTSLTGATTYVNGLAGTALTANRWAHVLAVLAADYQGAFTVKTGAQIGTLTLYSTTKTAAEAAEIYNSYVGATTYRTDDPSVINITEAASGIKLYQFDWTSTAA